MLVLYNTNDLEQQHVWLCETYVNILKNIVKIMSTTQSNIDPFASKYMSRNTTISNSDFYNSLLEITSYFWGSKGGRGTLLEKLFNLLGGDNSKHNTSLSDFLKSMIESHPNLTGITSQKFKQKFDLLNFVEDKLVILEIKNRIDSGGVAGRRDGLNKFFNMCKEIENNTTILADSKSGKEYTLPELLHSLGIKKLEMLMGLLYDTQGNEATIDADKQSGFYGASKKLGDNFTRKTLGITHDPNTLKIHFTKNDVEFVIQTVYGSNATKKFTNDTITLKMILDMAFPQSWDDIWLALNTGIEQRRLYLKHGKNHMTEMRHLYTTNDTFKQKLNQFLSHSADVKIVTDVSTFLQNNVDQNLSKSSLQNIADCIYLGARFIGK